MYCSKCGGNISADAKFCDHCGAQQVAGSQAIATPCGEAGQQEQTPVKKSKKKIIGIVLLCLQAVSILGTVANGEIANLTSYFTGGASGIFEMLGFFLPAIVGIALLVLDHLKKK
ncbi:MAG: hypothetical protein IJX01_03285 [Oscillospiraceae bacterium]|nr:hypothetical protein [Oscillospiraceae bacterium]